MRPSTAAPLRCVFLVFMLLHESFVTTATLSSAPIDEARVDASQFPRPVAQFTGTVIWVSTSGDASGDGSRAKPVPTISRALELVQPGQRIQVLPGRYALSDPDSEWGLTVKKSSIQIVGDPAGPVILEPAPGVTYGLLLQGDDLTLDGFTIRGFRSAAIYFGREETPQKNLILRNLCIDGGEDGIRSIVVQGPRRLPLASGVLVEGVVMTGATGVGFNIGEGPVTGVHLKNLTIDMGLSHADGSGADALAFESGDNVLIESCKVSHPPADGIDLKATRVAVWNSEVGPCGRNGIKLWRGGEIINTVVHHTGADAAIVLDGAGDYRIVHSVVAFHAVGASAYAMTVGYDQPDARITLEVLNSIFHQNAGALWISRGTSLKIAGSLLNGSANGELLVLDRPGSDAMTIVDGATLRRLEDLAIGRANLDPSQPPRFRAENTGDFRLGPGPGVDAGVRDGVPANDAEGRPRIKGRAPDLGPWELH